jgi:membrane protease subunit HflK
MRYVLLGLGGLLAVYTLFTMLTQVRPGERAVVRRFGRVLPDKPGPGLYRGLPWGVEQVDRVPVGRVRQVRIGFDEKQEVPNDVVPAGQLLTGDHNLVNVQAEVDYRVREGDVEKFLLQAERVDALVARAAETVLAEWVAGRTVDDVLLRGKADLPAYLRERTQERLEGYDLGVDVEQASVTRLQPPEQVKEAFDRLAQAEAGISTQVNRAEQEAGRKRSEAEAQGYQRRRAAAAYAHEQTVRAEAEADSFRRRLEQYRLLVKDSPDYLNTMWLDEMTRLYARMQEAGRIDVLDHFLSSEGLNITQFPLQPKKN